MGDPEDSDLIRSHRSYQRAVKQAEEFKGDPEKIEDLVVRAEKKTENSVLPKAFQEIRESVLTLFRMIEAYSRGDYRDIPWVSIALVVGTLIYFVSPIDVIPDVIPILGLTDDVTLLAWTIKQIKTDLDKFRDWEKARDDS